jgi:hypothetical protein
MASMVVLATSMVRRPTRVNPFADDSFSGTSPDGVSSSRMEASQPYTYTMSIVVTTKRNVL